MKKTMVLALLSIAFYNCSNEHLKNDFIGIWDDRPTGFQNQLQLYQDSVVSWSYCRKSIGTWEVNSTKLFLHFPNDPNYPNHDGTSTLKYRFNKTKDSLFVIVEDDSLEHVMMKVTDNWSHYLKEYNLKIVIPNANILTSLHQIDSYKYPTLYIGWKNNCLTVKGGEDSSKPLKTIDDYAESLLKGYMGRKVEENIHPITLVIDKEVSNAQIDSIKSIVNSLKFKDTYYFTVYNLKNMELKYGYINPDCNQNFDWYWYGLYDWNGLDQD
ncbi:hypothetical protein RQM59_08100 [Flavobacteriaceae bacterium S356]|uniref:Uncharacterized protein n=1 Tax=Asprobacillus argus TaxID=3076534 RepID=A0ABU3LFG7_9FLAO|nr:hypothetical protein [Flavobacteriaceae bacterium S356]